MGLTDRPVRLTQPILKVMRLLLEKPRARPFGAEISRATKVGPGTLYPMLARLEHAGWLTGQWEAIDPRQAGRPRRRFYWLTDIGESNGRSALAELQVAAEDLTGKP